MVRSVRWAVLMMGVATLAGCSTSGSVKTTPTAQGSSTGTASSSASVRGLGPVTFRPVLWNGTDQPLPAATDDSETRAEAALPTLDCTHPDKVPSAADTEYLAACSLDGKTKYLLGPSALSGARVRTAKISIPDGIWQVDVTLDPEGTRQFAALTTSLAKTGQQLAITAGATVESAPSVRSAITDGQVQINGGLDRGAAERLAAALTAG
ncbi:MAG: SecDF P1 head subdomain-containing protein [Catenulispora sp.]